MGDHFDHNVLIPFVYGIEDEVMNKCTHREIVRPGESVSLNKCSIKIFLWEERFSHVSSLDEM